MAIDKTSGFMKFSMVILSGNMVMDFFRAVMVRLDDFFRVPPRLDWKTTVDPIDPNADPWTWHL